jgi:hypothetical protein
MHLAAYRTQEQLADCLARDIRGRLEAIYDQQMGQGGSPRASGHAAVHWMRHEIEQAVDKAVQAFRGRGGVPPGRVEHSAGRCSAGRRSAGRRSAVRLGRRPGREPSSAVPTVTREEARSLLRERDELIERARTVRSRGPGYLARWDPRMDSEADRQRVMAQQERAFADVRMRADEYDRQAAAITERLLSAFARRCPWRPPEDSLLDGPR